MRRVGFAGLAILLMAAVPAAGQEALLGVYGAWVLDTEECTRIFANDNGRIVFGAQGRGPLPGFIINPAGISNNEYICEVREYRVRGPDVTFAGRCDFGRRKRTQKFAMRELNGSFQIEVGRSFVPVKRCEPASLKDLAAVRAEQERFARENVTALEKARGLWAASPEACARAFVRDGNGRYAVAPGTSEADTPVMITPTRFVTRGSTCTTQQVVSDLQTGREYQGNYLCTAEGREFPTTERIAILDRDAIERIPASRKPVPQRLVRCTPEAWEEAVGD